MPEYFSDFIRVCILINLSKIKSNTITIKDFDIAVIDGYESLDALKILSPK